MSVRHQRKWLLNLAVAGVVGGAAQHAIGASVTADPLSLEVQHRSDSGVYLESRAQVTASGMRNGFQSSFGNVNGAGVPNAGIGSVYYFKLPALAAGETAESASMWFSSVRDSAGTGTQPPWNVDFYAMGYEKSETPHTAPIDAGSTGLQSNYAQSLFYVGPNQVGATWTNATGQTSPIVKIQDNLLTGANWIPNSAGSAANAQRQISAQAELDLAAYIQANLYGNANFTANHDLFTVRTNPDVNTYTGGNQRYQISTNQTSTTTYPGLIVPTLNLVIGSQWAKNDSTSTWSGAGSWLGTTPNATDRAANFGSGISAPQTVNVDAPQTVAMLNFNNANSYTIAGSQITLEGVTPPAPPTAPAAPIPSWYTTIASNAFITDAAGSHTVSAPVVLNSNTTVSVAQAADTLTISSLNANQKNVTKNGAGTVAVGSHIETPALSVNGGKLKMASNGTFSRVIQANSLNLAAGATIDLTENKLITNTALGTFTAGAYTGVQGMVARAYDFGSWDQPGLMTSEPNAGPLVGTTTIGVSDGASVLFLAPTETGTFAGHTVTGASTIAVYTYAGDVNFDGLVDASDYGIIDNYFQFPGTTGYANGDFNYDGVIDAGDYGIIDNTFQLQGAPIPMSSGIAGVSAVPEPASAAGLLIASLGMALRRQRRGE
jgi:hypothetical protein